MVGFLYMSAGDERMTRPWRMEYDGAYYHVLSLGNEGRDIFCDDKDRRVFLDALGEMSERFEIEIYAFVFMCNHYLCGAPHK